MKNLTILAVLAIAAMVAPVTTHLAVSAYAEHKEASVRAADLERQQRALEEYSEEVEEYKLFATRVERFIGSARSAGISEEGWNRHHVDIDNRVASFPELSQFILDADGDDSYYFLPSKLQIQAGVSDRGRRSFELRDAVRDKVKVSLVGDFLVPVQ